MDVLEVLRTEDEEKEIHERTPDLENLSGVCSLEQSAPTLSLKKFESN